MAEHTDWTITDMYEYALDNGYSGVWDWALVNGDSDGNDGPGVVYAGISALRGRVEVEVQILGTVEKWSSGVA